MNQGIRVRFAPSPTGHLHVGGARTALFNWLWARNTGGTFVLRIEDTDLERSQQMYTDSILAGLRWLGLDWDEGPESGGSFGPYFQSQRMDSYRSALKKLLESGKLYHCFCSSERLEGVRKTQAEAKQAIRYDGFCRNLSSEEVEKRKAGGEKFVLRLKMLEGKDVSWNDVTKGLLTFQSDLLDDLVVQKSDGFPTYNFAVVIDDVTMKITHVIRGEDHISNTPKQIMIYEALGEPVPTFAHIPMILGPDRSRLSKRHGATSVVEYREMGFDPEAFRNYLALLGWSPGSGKEVLSKQELFQEFTLDRVSSHGAIFNPEKLRWMNAEYIKVMTPETLLEKLKPWLNKVPGFPGEYDQKALEKMVSLFRERLKTYDEIVSQVGWFFEAPGSFDEKGMEKTRKIEGAKDALKALVSKLTGLAEFSESALEPLIRGHAEAVGKKAGDIIHLCRLGLTGKTTTPGLFELMNVLGKKTCLGRLEAFLEKMG